MATDNKDEDLVMVGDGVEEGDQAVVPTVDEELKLSLIHI